ncbi:MAG: rhodanese-like domain-containing protein [Gemmatimonadetes bacterium]|nr:rhodanese-like domain-containing protein [Gemmatimonadota bacterium]MBT4612253.1 rhodanese-like domain-containing protein [Gemmatimonadota bacterium]MBT5056305.1 rhodanese-like domain-containing protein [Gemmatimonadota bacterium]MBT5145075.1 rhodanese-like domain-containing protein [Gemmatimonadota bacterium]MBT5586889.1 rhodanese-like domain-containing protein [Gemmatimonadota bacterium]
MRTERSSTYVRWQQPWIVFAMVLCCACTTLDMDDWPAVKGGIRQRYPQVRQISPAELDRWLSRSDTIQPILLDVRTIDEYTISHLPGADLTRHAQDARVRLQDVRVDTPIVLYCSIGYRSTGLAALLRHQGFTDVANLEGSIFAWANENRRLVDSERKPTTLVHPYDRPWSGLLDQAHRSE